MSVAAEKREIKESVCIWSDGSNKRQTDVFIWFLVVLLFWNSREQKAEEETTMEKVNKDDELRGFLWAFSLHRGFIGEEALLHSGGSLLKTKNTVIPLNKLETP